ncbi:MAG: hypothetical protein ACREUW_19965 [Burkholderiales bacterium]
MAEDPPRGWAVVKGALFAALAVNLAVFAWRGESTEALESAAWLALLLMFDLETRRPAWLHGVRRRALDGLRLVALAGILLAEVGYLRSADWLDAANAALWIAVVLLLEVEVRQPAWAARHRTGVTRAAGTLYAGLAVLVGAWAWRGEWFDAWDAALWLAAFVLLEMNVLPRTTAIAAARDERLQ